MLSRSSPIGRYAPSPTGDLHLGNLRTALAAYHDIRQQGGTFILRMEDTDLPRNVPGAAQRIMDDLLWLGLEWDEGPDCGGPAGPYTQSERGSYYIDALVRLHKAGLLYLCTCSRKDIQQSAASAPHGSDGPVYPGTCRHRFNGADTARFIDALTGASGSPLLDQPRLCLRLRTDLLPSTHFTDEIYGSITSDLARETGDFVIFRRDGLWAYQFVCAVDEGLMGISRVVRGQDLLSSTSRQVAILDALGFTIPIYRHIALAADAATGQRLSKRDGSQSLSALRKLGYSRTDVLNTIAALTDVKPLT